MCFVTCTPVKWEKGFGWKVFVEREGKLFPMLYTTNNRIAVNRWYTSKPISVRSGAGTMYNTAFSFCKKKNDAQWIADGYMGYNSTRRAVIRKVAYRDANYQGNVHWWFGPAGRDIESFQAKEMKILPKQK